MFAAQIESQRIPSFAMQLDELTQEYMWDPDREGFHLCVLRCACAWRAHLAVGVLRTSARCAARALCFVDAVLCVLHCVSAGH